MTRVVNRRWAHEPFLYVGRGSGWGNPFPVAEHGRAAMRLYLDWLRDEPEGQAVVAKAPELRGHVLGCSCTAWPAKHWRPCHAVVLARLAEGEALATIRADVLARVGPEQERLW